MYSKLIDHNTINSCYKLGTWYFEIASIISTCLVKKHKPCDHQRKHYHFIYYIHFTSNSTFVSVVSQSSSTGFSTHGNKPSTTSMDISGDNTKEVSEVPIGTISSVNAYNIM